MLNDYDLVVISPYVEKNYAIHTKYNINLGVLSLASYIDQKGFRVKILDFVADKNYLHNLQKQLKQIKTKLIAISVTSCFSYRSCKEIVKKIHQILPNVIVIVGGQQIIGLKNYIFTEIPTLKYACFGEGEATLLYILENINDFLNAPGLAYKQNQDRIKYNPSITLPFEELGMLNYNLYPKYKEKIPTIEESRGCTHKCNFCINSGIKHKVRIKPYQLFVDEILKIYSLYNKKQLFISIGCSTFGIDTANTIKLLETLMPHKDKFIIQTFTRCDINYEAWLPLFSKFNISSVLFGMESASKKMLINMNKTADPNQYLQKCQHLIDAFYKHKVNLWCNFIFGYVGETAETIGETLNFILKNKEKITYLSGHGLCAFPGNQIFENLDTLKNQYGISIDKEKSFSDILHYKINPSRDLTYHQLTALAQITIKLVNSKDNFMSVGAWRWWISPQEDIALLEEKMSYIPSSELPYSINITSDKSICIDKIPKPDRQGLHQPIDPKDKEQGCLD